MSAPILVRNLTKHYGETRALHGVSLEMRPGEVFGLLGPNGAGKTTLISILTTLETPTSGQAMIFGVPVEVGRRETKSFIGVVPQELVSHGFFTVEEVLHFHSGYYGISRNRERVEFLLKRLGLFEHRSKRVRQLSGGMRRRLLIAKALVHRPRLLVLDEPTAGVDIELRASLWEFVRELNAEGTSVLLTTHYLEEAERLCHRVGILHRGALLKVDETKALVSQLTSREIVLEVTGDTVHIQHPHLIKKEKSRLHFRSPSGATIGGLLREAAIPPALLVDVHIQEGRLEDAFVSLLKDR